MIEIISKATTANLGPGFDCLGLALDIENKVTIKEAEEEYKDKDSLIYLSIKKVFDLVGKPMPYIDIEQNIEIPICRGLGSSAACISAGCIAGNIMAEANLSIDELIKIGVEIEGHPDNIVPAFLGGFTISSFEGDEVVYFRKELHDNFKFAVMYPEYTLSTSEARAVLPKTISLKDGIYNIGKVSLLTAALIAGDGELLRHGCKDRIHQPYRKGLIEHFDEITNKARSLGAFASCLSGAGPTIIAIIDSRNETFEKDMKEFLYNISGNWTLKITEASNEGIRVI